MDVTQGTITLGDQEVEAKVIELTPEEITSWGVNYLAISVNGTVLATVNVESMKA